MRWNEKAADAPHHMLPSMSWALALVGIVAALVVAVVAVL